MNTPQSAAATTPSRAARPRRVGGMIAILAVASLLIATASASPPKGSDAPPIQLKDLSGATVQTKDMAPRTLVLIFGELTHEGVRHACEDVLDVLADPRVGHDAAIPLLVVAEDLPPAKLKETAAQGRFPAVILHDPKREAFGAYRVLVLPTVVVVDGKGKVVHAMPGFLPRFKEILTDAILLSNGQKTQEQFEQSVELKAEAEKPEQKKAMRLVRLGDELVRHGLLDMAESRYTEALAEEPACVQARVGLGDLMLRQDRPVDAEPLFRSALATDPTSSDAKLGLAMVLVSRGVAALPEAEQLVRDVLAGNSKNAKAHYVLGRVLEARVQGDAALAEYRRAAELLLAR